MSTEFDVRVILVVKELAEIAKNQLGRGYWKKLEEVTGVKARVWSNIYDRRQRATIEVLSAICKLKPQYAFWLTTGITDAVNGHVAPITATTFPERANVESVRSNDYFEKAIDLKNELLKTIDNDIESLLTAFERKEVFGANWWDGAISETAYHLSRTENYKNLLEAWNLREDKFAEHKKLLLQKNEPSKASVISKDPRSSHQHKFYMFYEAKNGNKEN